jgi:membrane-bound lytic murein transglycosylase D
MLVSASVTNRFVQADAVQTGQTDQRQYQYTMSAAELEFCCLYQSFDAPVASFDPPAPEKSAGDAVTISDIWVRMRSGFVFPVADPVTVQTHIDEYVKHPHLLAQLLHRGEPYLFHILNRLEQAGMPAELALLPVVESAFDPFATSPTGAAGIWQFMPATAADAGLDQDWWYDGRRDIIASTEAALEYLDQLHNRFDGDWLLALAAYNAGHARVRRAIRRNRDAGKPVDFWHLSLPAETRSYVPRLIALRIIIENPDSYNISLPTLSDTRYFSRVEIRGQIELSVAARLSGVSLVELQRLNPGYARAITPPDKDHMLLVPSLVEGVFRERIARLPQDQRIQSIRHRIRRGDNLGTIAQHYRTTVSELRKVNRLKGSKIIAGHLLFAGPAPCRER